MQSELHRELVYSRGAGSEREYVQDRLRQRAADIADLLRKDKTHIYVCGLRGLEEGVEAALTDIGRQHGSIGPPCGPNCAEPAASMSKPTELRMGGSEFAANARRA